MILTVDVLEVDVLVVDVLELDVLGARHICKLCNIPKNITIKPLTYVTYKPGKPVQITGSL
jgi:hypothetical protein